MRVIMKQSILGRGRAEFERNLAVNKVIVISAILLMIFLNISCTALRNDDNHTLMFVLNIATDVIFGWFSVAWISLKIIPMQRMLRLYDTARDVYSGIVKSASNEATRVRYFDCIEVTAGDDTERTLFLPVGNVELICGKSYLFKLSSNIITEVTARED